MTALVVQSLAESRLLYEGNWLLLVVIAIATRSGMVAREDVPGSVDSRRRDAPARPGAAAASSAVPSTAAPSPVGAAPAPSIAAADPGVA